MGELNGLSGPSGASGLSGGFGGGLGGEHSDGFSGSGGLSESGGPDGEDDPDGPGGVDERARGFSPAERRIAELLASEGRYVVAVAAATDRRGRERRARDERAGEGRHERPHEGAHERPHEGLSKVRRVEASRPDAFVDGEPTDFAALIPGDTSVAVAMALSRAARHADRAVIDARGSGLPQASAELGVRRFSAVPHSSRLRGWRIIGDGYDLMSVA